MENHIQDSKNIVTGHIDAQGNVIVGDVQQTVNYYLSINKDLEELKAKIEKLEKEIKEADSPKFKAYLQKELFEQKETYQKQFKAIEQAYYDVMKFNFTDEELKELQLLFLKGEHEEIRKKVNPVAIAHNIEMREKANEQDAYKMLVLAKSMAIQFDNPNRFEKTVEYYEISLQAERNLTNIFAFAHFLQEHNKNNKATPLYEEALAIRRQLAEVNPQTYLPDVGMTQINMAIFYLQSKPDKARSFELVDAAIMNLLPFQQLGYIQNYLKVAFQILEALGVDIEAYLKEKGIG